MARGRKQRDSAVPTGAALLHEPTTGVAIGVLALLVLLFFRNLLLGNSFLWEDFLYSDYPSRNFAAVAMASGELPLWNPYTFSGMPFLADIQKSVFYLPCTVLALVVRDGRLDAWWLQLVIVLHYILAGVGMYVLARSFELRRVPALFAGAAYMLSGFMITHAIHQYIVTLTAWYPLIFLYFRRALAGSWAAVFLGALALGHSILAGFPQLSLYCYFFLVVFFLFELFTTHRGAALVSRPALLTASRAAVFMVLSLALAAVQLLPTMELAELSQRAQITYQKATEGQLAWVQLVTLFAPKAFGSAGAGGYNYYGPGTYWYYWETCIYLGLLPLLLSVLSLRLLRGNKYVAFFWAYGVFALLFALGDNFVLHRLFFEAVPGFRTFRNAARMGVFLTFGAALLSAFTLQDLLHGRRAARAAREYRTLLGVSAGAGALLWLLSVTGMLRATLGVPPAPDVVSAFGNAASVAFVLLLAASAVILSFLRVAGPPRYAWILLIVVHFADMLAFGGSQNDGTTDPKEYFGRSAALVQFLREEGRQEVFRVNTRIREGMVMDRHQGLMDQIQMMEGYTPLVLQRAYPIGASWEQVLDMMNAKYRTVVDTAARALRLVRSTTYLPRAYLVERAEVRTDSVSLHAFMTGPAFDPRRMVVLEEDPGVPAVADAKGAATGTAAVRAYALNRIELSVESPRDAWLVLSEIFYPGWRATVDGSETRIYRANWNQRALRVKAGTHTVVVSYEPPPFRTGLWISGGALAVCAAGLVLGRTRRRPKPAEENA